MGRPLNSKYFGALGIGVLFHNGSAIVSGTIVRQISNTTYVVTDGTVTKNMHLAQTDAEAASPSGNIGTIIATVSGVYRYVKRINSTFAIFTDDTSVRWRVENTNAFPLGKDNISVFIDGMNVQDGSDNVLGDDILLIAAI